MCIKNSELSGYSWKPTLLETLHLNTMHKFLLRGTNQLAKEARKSYIPLSNFQESLAYLYLSLAKYDSSTWAK